MALCYIKFSINPMHIANIYLVQKKMNQSLRWISIFIFAFLVYIRLRQNFIYATAFLSNLLLLLLLITSYYFLSLNNLDYAGVLI